MADAFAGDVKLLADFLKRPRSLTVESIAQDQNLGLARVEVLDVLPDFLANAGGVVVSYFEWTQNLQQLRWDLELVNQGLEKKMVAAYRDVYRVAQERGVDLRTAAYMIALKRVADAEELRGH